MKTYCDKCKKLDVDSGIMVEMTATVVKYTNLRKTLEPKFQAIEQALNRIYGRFNPVVFCADCFVEIFEAPPSQ